MTALTRPQLLEIALGLALITAAVCAALEMLR